MRRAIVLAGGRGERLRPITDVTPKPLLPVLNRPVISWVLDALTRAGFVDVGVSVGYLGDQVERYVQAVHTSDMCVTVLSESDPRGTGGALRAHRAFMSDEPCLVVTADMITGVDLRAMADHFAAKPVDVLVAVVPRRGQEWQGDTVTVEAGGATRYEFKPTQKAKTVLGSAGTWIVDPEMLDCVVPEMFVDFSRDILPGLPNSRGHSLDMYDAGDVDLLDIGAFSRLRDINLELVARERRHDSTLGRDLPASCSGPVLVGQDASVAPDATVVGPAVIGDRVVVGPNAQIVESLLLPDAVVPAGIVIANGIYGPAQT